MHSHEFFMQRCLQLAALGQGHVAPNPLVGCVIVHNGNIIGEGYHQAFGQAHAEVNAINSVADQSLLSQSTLYVNLEPCSHHGKTPPCVDLILEKGIKKTIIAQHDPNPLVAGKGIALLKNAGVNVEVGILEKQAHEVNRHFNTFHEKKRPYVTLKWAETANGFIAPLPSDPDYTNKKSISSSLANRWVHKLRASHQAILVGANTAIIDNPRLNVRHWPGQNPLRIVLDPQLRLPNHLHLFDGSAPTLLIHDMKSSIAEPLQPTIEYVGIDFSNNLTRQLLELLFTKNIQSILVEGGKMVLETFLSSGCWDEAIRIVSQQKMQTGTLAPNFNHQPRNCFTISNDLFIEYENQLGSS